MLNFGHSVGHAIEAVGRFAVPHGRAVAIGMVEEMRLAGCAASDRQAVQDLLAAAGMPAAMPTDLDRGALWQAMTRDKKSVAGKVLAAVPDGIGRHRMVEITRERWLADS